MIPSNRLQAKICAARRFPFWDHCPSEGSVVTAGTWYLGPIGGLGLPFLRHQAGKLSLINMNMTEARALIEAIQICYGITTSGK